MTKKSILFASSCNFCAIKRKILGISKIHLAIPCQSFLKKIKNRFEPLKLKLLKEQNVLLSRLTTVHCANKASMFNISELEKKKFVQVHNKTEAFFCLLQQKEDYKIRRYELMPGNQLSHKQHTQNFKGSVIIKGAGRVNFNDRSAAVHTGDTLSIPAGTAHSIKDPCLEKLVFIEIDGGDNL